jgi:hypothetical protein
MKHSIILIIYVKLINSIKLLKKMVIYFNNCLVLRHTKYNGVQQVYCNPFLQKQFYGSHRLDPVMICQPGI